MGSTLVTVGSVKEPMGLKSPSNVSTRFWRKSVAYRTFCPWLFWAISSPVKAAAGGEGVLHDDRMGRIDVGVPAADGAVDRIEDQEGRRGLAVLRDHKVRRRVVDDAGGVAARPDPSA